MIRGIILNHEYLYECNKINNDILELCQLWVQFDSSQNSPPSPLHPYNIHMDGYIDPRDKQIYQIIKINGNTWMAQNLNFNSGEGCNLYKDNPNYETAHGRLYSWKSAIYACPPGWRIPSEQEWKDLMNYLGGYYDGGTLWGAIVSPKAIGDPKLPYEKLFEGGETNFNVKLSGFRDLAGFFTDLDKCARYWTSSESGTNEAWYYEFWALDGGSVRRKRGAKSFQFSCRCIWDKDK